MVTTQKDLRQQSQTAAEPLPDWYDKWRERIQAWVEKRVDRRLAWIVLLVPDFFALMVRLIRDERVSRRTKLSLLVGLGYVLLPFDFLPEMLLGVVGLVDDASVMGLSLYGLHAIGSIDPTILRQHWSGNGDVVTVITTARQYLGTNVFGTVLSAIWKRFKATFRSVPAK